MTYGFEEKGQISGIQNQTQTQDINSLWEKYKKEMRYLRNFEERTLRGYQEVYNRWIKYVGEMPTEQNLSQWLCCKKYAGTQKH